MLSDVDLKENESDNDLTDWFHRLWPTVVIVGAVLVTVFGGLLLAYQDMPEKRPPVVVRPTPTQTPVPPMTPLPSPTLTPPSAPSFTPTSGPTVEVPTATWTPQVTPVPTFSPTLTPPPPCLPPASWRLYIVQSGDTLPILAARHGTSSEAIMQANCLSSPTIYPGQQLYLPPIYITLTPTRSPTPCRPPVDWQIYVVKKGDTLYSLAQLYNTNVYAIVQANCLTDYAIYVGQNLYLPPLPATLTPTVTPTPTPMPTATWTSIPTWTLVPTDTPTVTATPIPTAVPTTTDTPMATETPTMVPPTTTETPTEVPPPATATPSPSATFTTVPTVTSTAAPTLTPIPPPPTATPSSDPTTS